MSDSWDGDCELTKQLVPRNDRGGRFSDGNPETMGRDKVCMMEQPLRHCWKVHWGMNESAAFLRVEIGPDQQLDLAVSNERIVALLGD